MRFNGLCLITDDVPRLVRFSERLAGVAADGDEIHAEILVEGVGLAIYDKAAAERDMRLDFAEHFGAGRVSLGFTVEDVDAEYERLLALGIAFVTAPRTHPWGWRSAQLRDPDGNLVSFACRP